MRILVAVLGARAWPYPWLVDTIKRTWASVELPGVQTVFYSGGASRLERRGRDVLLPVSDLGQAMAGKSLAFFDYALAELEFDVLFRPNCSSYVDLRNLVAYTVEHGRPERWYAGTHTHYEGLTFASGAGYFLSRDLMELVVAGRDRFAGRRAGDQVVAEVLLEHDVRPEPVPRRDLTHHREVGPGDTSHFHFRCKTATRNRYGDVRIMYALRRAFLRERGQAIPGALTWHELPAALLERAPDALVAGAGSVVSRGRAFARRRLSASP